MYVAGEITGTCPSRIGYTSGKHAVGNGFGEHPREVAIAQVVKQRLSECFSQSGDRPSGRLNSEHITHAGANGPGQPRQSRRQGPSRRDHLPVPEREGGSPLPSPRVDVVFVGRPRKPLCQFGRNRVEAKDGPAVVPAQNLERGQVAAVACRRKMREADLTGVACAVVGDEQQIVRRPGLPLSVIR